MPIKKKQVMWEELVGLRFGEGAPGNYYSKAEIDAFFEGEDAGKKQVDWARITSKPSTFTPSAHALVGAKHTASGLTTGHYLRATGPTTFDFQAIASADLPSHASSHLVGAGDPLSVGVPVSIGIALLEGEATNFARRDHVHTHPDGLGANRHHPQLHAAEHEITEGGDLVHHDNLSGFVVSEHTSLPNTIAAVLSDHDKAAHDALGIDAATWDGHQFADYLDQAVKTGSDVQFNKLGIGTGAFTYVFDINKALPGEWVAYIRNLSSTGLGMSIAANSVGEILELRDYEYNSKFKFRADGKFYIGANYIDSLIANNKVPDSNRLNGQLGSYYATTTRKLDDFGTPDDNTDLNATTGHHGLLMKLGGGTTNFLRADGTWATPVAAAHASSHLVGAGDPLSVGVPVSIGIALLEGEATNFARRDHVHTHPDGLGANRHHPQLHAAEHEITEGGDLVHHDNLSGFVVSEHTSLPNTIAAVLSDHNAAAHNTLAIDHGSLSGKDDDDHSIYYNATRHTKAIHDALAIDHGSLGGRGDDDHSIYYNAARHTKAVHDALNIDADLVDGRHLPNTIAQVLTNHTKAVHDALLITVLGSGALAKDHGTASIDMLVNICFGTGNPPPADETTHGALFVKYQA